MRIRFLSGLALFFAGAALANPQAVVKISILRNGRIISDGSGAFVSPDGVVATSFELMRTVLESDKASAQFQSQKGGTLTSFEFVDCAKPTEPCLLRLPVKPTFYLRLGTESGAAPRILGYQGEAALVNEPLGLNPLTSPQMLLWEDGAVLVNAKNEWLRVLTRVPSPEGPAAPAWSGYDFVTFKRRLALPSENVALARRTYGDAQTAAATALDAKYVKVAYNYTSDRKTWPADLFKGINYGKDPIFMSMLPRWFTRCANRPPYAIECSDATGSAYFRVSVSDVDSRFLQSHAGKPWPNSGSSEPISCKDGSGIDKNAPLLVGYECQYALNNDGYPNAFSVHNLLQKGGRLYDFWIWHRDPFMRPFFVHIPALVRISAVPAGK